MRTPNQGTSGVRDNLGAGRDPGVISLDDYLRRTAARSWSWGHLDCCTFVMGWILAATGIDPMAQYRGVIDDAIGAARLLKAHGGLLKMMSVEMARCGFRQIDRPDHGDVAIATGAFVNRRSGCGDAAAVICCGPWFVGMARTGIIGAADMSVLASWQVSA